MKIFRISLLLLLSLTGFNASAQVANDVTVQNAILAGLPAGVTPEKASADEIAQAAATLAFNMKGKLEDNLTQVMVALGELTQAGRFKSAPRFGTKNPTERLYVKVMNMASSNLDVASTTYYKLTVQDLTRLAAAAREGQNFLNGAKSNAITRKKD